MFAVIFLEENLLEKAKNEFFSPEMTESFLANNAFMPISATSLERDDLEVLTSSN